MTDPLSDKIQSLIQTLTAGDAAEKCAAAEALGDQGAAARAAVPALLGALDDKGWWVCKAWWELPEWGTQWMQIAYVREKAVRALFKIHPAVLKEARPTMIGLLERPSEYSLEFDDVPMGYVRFSDQEWSAAGGKP